MIYNISYANRGLKTDSYFISTKFSNFNKYDNDLDLDVFLTNLDSLPCKCNNSHFANRHHKNRVIGDLRIYKNNALRKKTIIRPKYRYVRPVDIEKTEGLRIVFQVAVIKIVLIHLSFRNARTMMNHSFGK